MRTRTQPPPIQLDFLGFALGLGWVAMAAAAYAHVPGWVSVLSFAFVLVALITTSLGWNVAVLTDYFMRSADAVARLIEELEVFEIESVSYMDDSTRAGHEGTK